MMRPPCWGGSTTISLQALPALRAEYPEGSITTEVLSAVPALRPDPAGAADPVIARLVEQGWGTVPFGTEAGLFQQAGIPAIVMGPGTVAEAHQPNEFVTADQLRQGAAFLDRLVASAAG